MKTLFAFFKKEWIGFVRTGHLTILLLLSALFGIMNPAIAKLTPWLMKTMSSSLESSGIIVTEVTVDASVSWMQFYKNIPFALLVFVLLFSSLFTREYQKGTLISVLTKGLSRWKVVAAKTALMFFSWTACYWLCFGITYGYNAYFWNNSILSHLLFSAVCFWILGIWVLSLVLLFSAWALNSTMVLAGTGGVFLGVYLIGLFPIFKNYMPVSLMNPTTLLTNNTSITSYYITLFFTLLFTAISIVCSFFLFRRKKL